MDNPSNHEQWHTASSDTYFFADAYLYRREIDRSMARIRVCFDLNGRTIGTDYPQLQAVVPPQSMLDRV
jgi:hypothetical protein